ncbi:MAG: hypothetical protein KKC80_08530 [Candidatus Margulisbacteria bacterium]|nr:hypothetical protein [Candidatus Margulisiibacteriota bacterium]MBU1617057.1 hypothetical protein [Candidatus Margulisiibacteriota bacterium]MBU1867014.1 hypothetical protein [Candidatus Margulisiibacteriota bacterium]
MKRLLPILAIIFFIWIFYWALFVPKEDVSGRIYNSLKEQEKKADLIFKKVTVEEVVNGVKYWQLEADTGMLNKNAGLAALQNVEGTFFNKGKAVLKFSSPAALWEKDKKEIYLDNPVGYDIASEGKIDQLVSSIRAGKFSFFSFPKEYKKGLGYWFKAKNLRWRLADQKLVCQGGIMLNKGDAAAYAETLSGDVEFKKMELSGSPRIIIGPAGSIPATLEAESFEITGSQDIFTAIGNPRIRWHDAYITAKNIQYYQQKKKLKLSTEVTISFRDIKAWGDKADYFTEDQQIVLSGNAKAEQGTNKLTSDQVMVSLKEQKISLVGKSKLVINK